MRPWLRNWCIAIRPIWNSSVLLRMAFSGEPMSGSWLATELVSSAACTATAKPMPASNATRAPASGERDFWRVLTEASTDTVKGGSLKLLGCKVRQARALVAHQRDVHG